MRSRAPTGGVTASVISCGSAAGVAAAAASDSDSVGVVEGAGTVADAGLGQHEVDSARGLEVTVQGRDHGATCSKPVMARNDGARP